MIKLTKHIVEIRFGSHLYGTATPASDLDTKAVHIPDHFDILLGRAKGSIVSKRIKSFGEKNRPDDEDVEDYSLQRFLGLLAEGQTVALDMLFAPRESMLIEPSWEWGEIVKNRHRLVSRKSSAFVGYCRKQASKYGIKGSRVATARAALALLSADVLSTEKLATLHQLIEAFVNEHEHCAIVPIRQVDGSDLLHFEVCDRKFSYRATVKSARDIVQRIVDEYGKRALQAESNLGVDWKALSHAVRVATQALELLATGHVTLPLPNAAHVLDIKLGRLPYQEVAAEIEDLLEQVEAASVRSTLPAEPDRDWIDWFVAQCYWRHLKGQESAA